MSTTREPYVVTYPSGLAVTMTEFQVVDEMQRHGFRYSEMAYHLVDLIAGHVLTADDGVTFARVAD